jgi:hypothetical protein
MEHAVSKIMPERPQGAVKMHLLSAGRAKSAGHLCATVEANAAVARMPLTGIRFDSPGQQPACHNIAHCFDLTRHGISIAAGPALVIAFAF